MKCSAVLATFSAVGLTSAQSLEDVPQCARQCLGPAMQQTGCSQSDIACMCQPQNREKIVAGGTTCVLSNCGQETALNEVLPAITRICEKALGQGGSASGSASGTTAAATTVTPTSTVVRSPTASRSGSASGTAIAPTSTVTSRRSSGTQVPSPMPTNGTRPTTAPVPAAASAVTGFGTLAMLAFAALVAF